MAGRISEHNSDFYTHSEDEATTPNTFYTLINTSYDTTHPWKQQEQIFSPHLEIKKIHKLYQQMNNTESELARVQAFIAFHKLHIP